jgi:hypothetical protein
MKRILSFLLLLSALPIFNGCITDTKTEKPDTIEVGPNGERKPRTPKVTYITSDSLVLIQITGSGTGQENAYWIRRDGKLLEQPSHQSADTIQNLYVLLDSLTEIGVHKYYVQYGTHPDSLSDKSTEFIYEYSGHSRSGRVSIHVSQEQLVSIAVLRPVDEVLGAFIVERKIGSGGRVIALDTVELGSANPDNFEYFLDTALVPEDVYLYYRVKALDAITEEYLPPSPWDSVLVKNKVWKYVPAVQFEVTETGVHALISNVLNYADNGTAYYFLYRNATAEKAGRSKVDSLPISGFFPEAGLHDEPDSGDHYYWVEARDPWGRVSARSAPKLIHFSGRAMGPAVQVLQSGQGTIHIQPFLDQEAAYYIIQRAQDTAKDPASLDTLTVSSFFPYNTTYIDRPTADGVYFYRAISIRRDGGQTDPGAWGNAGFFHFDPVFSSFTAAIVNRGDRVQCQVERLSDFYYILFRSKTASGPDTAAVDTLWYSDAASMLVDTPPIGAWYYRVQRIPAFPGNGSPIYRSASTRIDFTGKPAGPAVTSLNVYSSRIDITFTLDPDGLAYILERSMDGKDWIAADTASALDVSNGLIRDKPPADGFWNYRLRTVRKDMSVTEPGTPFRSLTLFTFGPQFNNNLNAYVENKGTRLDFPMYGAYNYVYYLMRSDKGDWKDGKRVDSLMYNDPRNMLTDTPPKGVWFYWVQREPIAIGAEDIISRSVPIRVEFTGSLEITSISKNSLGIQITFPYVTGIDTLEIHRSSGNPDDLNGFALLASVSASSFTTTYFDATVAGKTGFYHYRLATKSGGVRSGLGAAKSVYFDVAAGSGLSQGLLKRAATP